MQRKLETPFHSLAKAEPRLLEVLAEIDRIKAEHKNDKHICANSFWYGSAERLGIKQNMKTLVGWSRNPRKYRRTYIVKRKNVDISKLNFSQRPMSVLTEEPRGRSEPLYSSQAYDLAYDFLYSRLPDCRHASRLGCFMIGDDL